MTHSSVILLVFWLAFGLVIAVGVRPTLWKEQMTTNDDVFVFSVFSAYFVGVATTASFYL